MEVERQKCKFGLMCKHCKVLTYVFAIVEPKPVSFKYCSYNNINLSIDVFENCPKGLWKKERRKNGK